MKLTRTLLSEIYEIIEVFERENYPPKFNPSIALLSALVLTISTSLSNNILHQIMTLIFSIVVLIYTKSPFKPWFKIVLFTTALSIMITSPYLFTLTRGSSSVNKEVFHFINSYDVLAFIMRTASSVSIFVSFLTVLGWHGVLDGLASFKVPKSVLLMISIVIVNIPLIIREIFKFLLAREARIISKMNLKTAWYLLSSVAGDLLIRCYYRSWMLNKALRARTFDDSLPFYKYRNKITGKDFILISSVIILIFLRFIFRIISGI